MTSQLPHDYAERVYAGVLGKIIGVYLGRPFECWMHDKIVETWGQIDRYVHEDRKVPLIVTDDDISGTFTFVRALLDHGLQGELGSREVGQTWLNYIAEGQHILWWGGIGMSTEHTAFLRLRAGIEAPRSGSTELNGRAVAEEIGAQIFIDGWALVSPNQPEQAARLATAAARVSHDGEAVHGAVVIAVMESLAFVEPDIDALQQAALRFIPADCEIARLIHDLRRWRTETDDWREALRRLVADYGYEKYGTNCPMLTNHGVVQLALLWGGGDFDRSLMIVNTCGFDTDCNSGNVGCLLAIRNGLDCLNAGYDWRGPVNDRMYLPAADGHWGLYDAARVAQELIRLGEGLAARKPQAPGQTVAIKPAAPGPKYTFPFRGSTHGFHLDPEAGADAQVQGSPGPGSEQGLTIRLGAPGRALAEVNTFIPPDALQMQGYGVAACPALWSGQWVRAVVRAAADNNGPLHVALAVRVYKADKTTRLLLAEPVALAPGATASLDWVVPETEGLPICAVGLQGVGGPGAAVRLVSLDFGGTPALTLRCPKGIETWDYFSPWHQSMIRQLDLYSFGSPSPFNLCQFRGQGLLHTGTPDWTDYAVRATLRPWLGEAGLLARVRGLTRYYAAELRGRDRLVLVRRNHEETILASHALRWEWRDSLDLTLEVRGTALTVRLAGTPVLTALDPLPGLECGGVGLLVREGRLECGPVEVRAL